MNHACEPNALVFYEGRQLRVRALRPLRAGEEITMNYTDPKAHVLTRQPALKTFFIDCKCEP
jgi:SET and MYND domain-containing protein